MTRGFASLTFVRFAFFGCDYDLCPYGDNGVNSGNYLKWRRSN
jgi:hypothetical protein